MTKRIVALPLAALVVVLAALGVALLMSDGRHPASLEATSEPVPPGEVRLPPDSPKLASISVDTVRARREKVVVVLPAQLVLDEDHTVRVTSPVLGRVRSIDAAPGDHVEAGRALAHIASSDVAQAQSDLQRAEAALTTASTSLVRARDLFAHQVIAQRELQQAVNDSAQARAERDRAQARVQQLGASPSVGQDYVLRAPIAGDVVDRTLNPGMEVRPDLAVPLFTVSSLDTLWLVASVYERDLAAVRRGEHVLFTTEALPGRVVSARVSYVSSALDPVTRTATLRALVSNGDRALHPSTFGDVKVVAPDSSGVPVVPILALVTHGAETVVFVQTAPGRFSMRPVQVTDDDGQTAVVVSGLRPGEVVVTRGSLLLSAEATPVR
ncbi:MAG: efflux RND transporter periplasmic adaptor subunit [Gemmatimonadales bacterium]